MTAIEFVSVWFLGFLSPFAILFLWKKTDEVIADWKFGRAERLLVRELGATPVE